MLPEFDPGVAESCPPMSDYGGGDFFSQELGSLLRIRYNTESYGQDEHGNLDIGTMKVWNFDDAITFFDGQVTLNDESGVGFNTGIGVRWMGWTPFPLEPERITGVSVWADGTHTSSGAFFPQVGVTWESLGDLWDFRANSYIPIGTRDQVGTFTETGDIVFQENFLVSETVADRFTSFNAAELEFARRLGQERDAWMFAGPYALVNDDDDTAGYRVGVRGYAYPDLLVQFAVSDDEIFHTNASFSLVWFVGRTRSDYQPACGLPDRMREPVMRNDYVVLAKDQEFGGIQLTDTSGDAFRFVHVDSDASGGGDGTFENPLNNVGNVNGNSLDGDIVLLYSDSVFSTQGPLVLRDNQRLLGEGDNMTFQIMTQQEGTIDIPETSPGSQAGAKPIIANATSDAIVLADTNEVANLAIDGGQRGIVAGPDGAGNPNLHDLMIMNTSGDGIVLTPFVRDDDDDPVTLPRTVAFNVTIDDVMFDNIGGDEMVIDAESGEDVTDANVTLQETIMITDVTSTNGNGRGLLLSNTHSGRTTTILNYMNGEAAAGTGGGNAADGVLRFTDIGGNLTMNNVDVMNNVGYAFDFLDVATTSVVTLSGNSSYDGGAGAAGGMRFDGFDGMVTVSNTTFENGTLQGALLTGTSDGTFTFNTTATFDAIGGTAFDVNDFTGTLTMNSEIISNTTGRAISVQNVTLDKASLMFGGDITMHDAAAEGIFIANNTDGTVIFAGDSTLVTSGGANAVTMLTNGDMDISLNGLLDITTTGGGIGFSATGGGLLTAVGTMNTIDVEDNIGLQITGMEITNAGVRFQRVDVANAPNGIVLMDNTGPGMITVGDAANAAGEGGTLSNFGGAAIVVQNTNATFNGVDVDGANGTSIDVIHSNADAMAVAFNQVNVDAQNAVTSGITVTGTGATGAFTMTSTNTDIESDNSTALLFTDLSGTTTFTNLSIHDSWSGVAVVTSDGSFTFNNQTTIETVNAIDFEVSGGTATVNMQGDITNTDATGRSVHIHDVTGGSVIFTNTALIDDHNEGLLIENNTGGGFTFLGTNDFDTGANDAVTLTNNMGATMSFAALTIDTTGTGNGFVATGGGTVSVTGLTNVIDTENGMGLQLTDMTIGAVDFQRVTVDGGAADTAIELRRLEGGQVAIGSATGAANSGGVLNTVGDAIILEDVANVDLRQIQIVNAGDAAGEVGVRIMHTAAATGAMDVTIDGLNLDNADFGPGALLTGANEGNDFRMRLLNSDLEENVEMGITGAGSFFLLVDSTDINETDMVGNPNAFQLTFSGNASSGDVTFRNGNDFVANTGAALFLDSSGATAKTVRLLVQNSDFATDSPGVNAGDPEADAAVDIRSRGGTTIQATIQGNTFDKRVAGGNDFDMRADGATARARLLLGGDDAAEMNTAAGIPNSFIVRELNGADFDIFDLANTITLDNRNIGPVDTDPNDAAFQDLPIVPTLPALP